MKVALFISNGVDKVAGLEKHFIELANGICDKVDLTIIAHHSYHKYMNDKIKCIDPKISSSRYNLFSYIKLYKILKENNFDVVHSQANKATYFMAKLKPFFKNTKFVATLHNKKKKIEYFNEVDHVIGVSNFVCEQIKNNKTTIYNGLDIEKIQNSKPVDLKNTFHINNNYPTLLSIGRLVKAKGFSYLIEAVKDLNVNILIVGDGPLKDELKEKIEKFNLQDRVMLAGFRDDVFSLIKSSDGVVISSLNEGFSYVFAEALILEKPLISTDVADIKLFIPHQFCSNIADINQLKSNIENFIQNQNMDFSNYYQKAKDEFDINKMFTNTINIYKELYEKN